MSLTIRSTMNNQAAAQGLNDAGKSAENTGESKNRKTINASELNLKPYKDNQIDAKRLRARKQAMKLISDAWKSADKTDKNIDDMKLDKLNKLDEITELKKKVSDLENEKEAYRVDYGVDKDSQEQKDLELLEKYQNNRYGSAEDTFSKEELERLKELQNTPLTEYQEKVLKLNSSQIHFKDEIGQKELKIACTTASIALAEIDRDKSQEMLKAQDSADQIIGAVEGEVKNLLVAEGKDNIDDKAEENKEKADEAEKKQEEQQAQIEATKQTVSMLVIDKKRMPLKESGLPQMVIEQTPKLMRRSKLPIVKAKIGPKIAIMIADEKVFDLIPLKKEIKAEVSGLYIVGVKGIRGSLQTPAPKKKGFFAKFKKDKTAR